MCQQATASDFPFYDNFAPQKLPVLKIFDDVIAGELWFGTPPIKNPGYAYGSVFQIKEKSDIIIVIIGCKICNTNQI